MADIKRLNYFNYQFLVEKDFNDEQDYHLGMRRRHNAALHSWGVADGLAVSKTGNKEVTIGPGVALDSNGREIVLLDAAAVDLTSFGPNANVHLTIAYEEVFDEADRYTSGGVDDYTRTTERVKIEGKSSVPGDGSVIDIALVKLDNSGNVNSINDSVRKLVGSKIGIAAVGATELANNAVTGPKIANNAITTGKIGPGAVTSSDLANRVVSEPKLASNAVSARTIQNASVGNPKIANDAVTSAKIREADGTTGQNASAGAGIKTAHLQNQAVSLAKLDSALKNTVSRAVQNTGGTVNGNLQVNGRLSVQDSVSGSTAAQGINTVGKSNGNGTVYGAVTNAGGSGTGKKIGIYAHADATAGHKYAGRFIANTSGTGNEVTYGIHALSSSNGSGIVHGVNILASGGGTGPKYGISAQANAAKGQKYGGYFYANTSGTGSEQTIGVRGSGTSSGTGKVYGVRGIAAGNGSGAKYGIYGSASGGGTKYAGFFAGRVHIAGQLSKAQGSFLIDHVLDPKNKTLRHGFVESPEDLCLYRGKVKLNAKGEATVKMPDYFSALTKEEEATVTLTPIGRKPFLAGYEWNKTYTAFKVFGEPSREVTYIVLADRDDPTINYFRKPVEEAKGNGNFEKGKLIHPEAYGEPPETELERIEEEGAALEQLSEAMEEDQREMAKQRSDEEEHAQMLAQLTHKEVKRLKELGLTDEEIGPIMDAPPK